MENKEVNTSLRTLYGNGNYDGCFDDYKKVSNYIEKLEREIFGLRKQVSNLKEKEEKAYRYD